MHPARLLQEVLGAAAGDTRLEPDDARPQKGAAAPSALTEAGSRAGRPTE